ncbi:UDP-glycosyltransferase 74E2-like [Panicum miliaceum]|uniref:UDP-glycosyltransferase 74E2-like n=1 Tax=Panicum miliaceum TaxID=4540 RepID=A0A3L6TTI7_PANMI|nr:UDP-glycosyltransferase 74E2-like [Panicum miliaceum]
MAGSESDQSVHVLLVWYPTQGHINPLLQFGKRLAAHRGVRCTLVVTRYVLGSGKQPQPGAVHVVAFSDGCDRRGYDEVGDERGYLARLESAGSESLGELLRTESAKGRPVRAVVYDTLLLWVPRVARRHGVSCAAFFTHACAVIVAYAHAWAGQLTLPVGDAPPELPGLPVTLGTADFPKDLSDPDSHLVYRDLMLQQSQELEVADHVLINSFHELQVEEAEYMALTWGAMTVGPTVPSAYLDNCLADDISYGFHLHTPMAAERKAWLDERHVRSVVYVSFGSLVTLGSDQMAEVAEGLYNSGKAFLWVVRASETSKVPIGFTDKVKARGLIVTWSPQLDVLAHQAIGCFVTHCGWNSTVEGVAAGVPMVAMPQ